MEKKYRILAEFIKNISAETPNVESFIYTKDNISKYRLHIDIKTKPLKSKMAEVAVSVKFKNTEENDNKSFFEMIYAIIVKINDEVNTKEELEPIFLKEVPTEVYPRIEESFLKILGYSGFPNVNFETKVDFEKLYNERKN
tara:strand:+ start:5475 stop:5897 length:423 start_codon:yes stop_codon:yes gene_type:complete